VSIRLWLRVVDKRGQESRRRVDQPYGREPDTGYGRCFEEGP